MLAMEITNGKIVGPVVAQPGRPLYLLARDRLREAIDSGIFLPGQQMPSTKQLSEMLGVSLVTAHRALQELVSCGALYRAQGKGTFVHDRYFDNGRRVRNCRIGLLFRPGNSLEDCSNSPILEGVRQAAQSCSADLVFLHHGEDVRNECNGYIYLNPSPEDALELAGRLTRRQPLVVVGTEPPARNICAITVDQMDLARQAVDHLYRLGHRRVGYVGGDEQLCGDRERWAAFAAACKARGLVCENSHVVRASGWRLDEREQAGIIRMLSSCARPTAIFAAGYYFALNLYTAAAVVGLTIPNDLSLIGVGDPASAAHLFPPLTTLRPPLLQLGQAAVSALAEFLQGHGANLLSRTLCAELVVRRSTGMASAALEREAAACVR